jgi:hypothetical protein
LQWTHSQDGTRQKLEDEEREASKQALGTLMFFAKGFVFSFCQYL